MADLVQKKGGLKSKNTVLPEGIPTYREAGAEIIIPTPQGGKNNTYIVFGRDRPGAKSSGYGGLGASHAGAISIVAGRMGQSAADLGAQGTRLYADPDHKTDAAFIYMSQKTDIDKNLQIKPETAPPANDIGFIAASGWDQSEAKSGIVLKADNVRMIARQKIKLVTGTDNKLSTGADSSAVYGVDLIAGNDPSDSQPIVKGENLRKCLIELREQISLLNGALAAFVGYQLEFNVAALNHYHLMPGPGHMPVSKTNITPNDMLAVSGPKINTRIISRTIPTLKNQRSDLATLESTYLQRGHAKDGKTKYINSLYNTVN